MSSAIHSVKFSSEALAMFQSQIEQFGTIETGGVLMGYLEQGILHIEKASDCGPNATHDQIYFKADANYIDMFIDMECANSGGKNTYLGEWHTHPQIMPEPSKVDFQSLYEIAATAKEFALLLILGAVNYRSDNFSEQHILILKYKNDRRYFRIV